LTYKTKKPGKRFWVCVGQDFLVPDIKQKGYPEIGAGRLFEFLKTGQMGEVASRDKWGPTIFDQGKGQGVFFCKSAPQQPKEVKRRRGLKKKGRQGKCWPNAFSPRHQWVDVEKSVLTV